MQSTKNISTDFLSFIGENLDFVQLKLDKLKIAANLHNQNNSNPQTHILIPASDDSSTDGGRLDLEIIQTFPFNSN